MDWSKYVGIPYVFGGSDFSGCDCLGLIHIIYKELNIDIPVFNDEDYSKELCRQISKKVNGLDVWKQTTMPKKMDVILLRIAGHPIHAGIMMDSKRFIHSVKGPGSCIELADSPVWENRILGFFRHREVFV